MFTSDLTMDEALVLDEVGLEPIEIIVSSSYFHTGVQWGKWGQNMELTALTAGLAEARRHALAKAVAESLSLGADGLVGTRIDLENHGHHAHFVLTATAVRSRGATWRTDGRMFTSNLSGQELVGLARAGWRPRAYVLGICVYHIAHQGLGAALRTVGRNVEMPTYTQAMYEARGLAMTRLETEAQSVGATGVVGVDVVEGNHGWRSHVTEFLATGTAIAPAPGAAPLGVTPVLSVNR